MSSQWPSFVRNALERSRTLGHYEKKSGHHSGHYENCQLLSYNYSLQNAYIIY